ncbi:1-phosphofructokinase family hexose kinase [Helcococcus kunzii]
MIITITPNPAIDIAYFIEDFKIDNIHKVSKIFKTAGGKGLNVSKVLKILGSDILATGFLGGNSGNYIRNELERIGIKNKFIDTNGETRTTYSINDNLNGTTTEIREAGPTISKSENEKFFEYLSSMDDEGNIFACSGSLPNGLDSGFYDRMLDILENNKVIIDTSGANLRHIVFDAKKKPYAIKPNIDEIRDLFGEKIDSMSKRDILEQEAFKNIPIVIISLGKDGCVAKIHNKYYECKVPKIESINPVGSGDSSIAGLAYSISNNLSEVDTLKYSMACGVLNALEEEIGHINIDNLEATLEKIMVNEI